MGGRTLGLGPAGKLGRGGNGRPLGADGVPVRADMGAPDGDTAGRAAGGGTTTDERGGCGRTMRGAGVEGSGGIGVVGRSSSILSLRRCGTSRPGEGFAAGADSGLGATAAAATVVMGSVSGAATVGVSISATGAVSSATSGSATGSGATGSSTTGTGGDGDSDTATAGSGGA